jgi:NitT/TauT family transport system ATP-binding protein
VARIEFRRVGKSFMTREGELTALAGIDMSVADKEFVTLVGASGCGKSTLLNLIAGFETPTSGVILVDGAPIAGPGPDRGVVFQHTALFPWLSVADNIAFGLKLRANKGKGSPQVVTQRMLERTGLLPFRARLPAELSERKTAVLVTHDIDEAIYLADRTVVMTAHPGRIREIFEVDLPRPRRYEMRSHPRFIELRDHVTGIVRSEALEGDAASRRAA